MEAGFDYLNRAIEQDRTLSVQDLRLIRRDFARLQGQVELLSRKYYSALCTKCGYMRPATEIEKENEALMEFYKAVRNEIPAIEYTEVVSKAIDRVKKETP